MIPQFVERWREGNDVVYAVRRNRKEGPAKRLGYFAFYRLLNAISDLDIPLDSGDFCLMDRKVVDALKALPERTRFVRGLRTFVGFRQVGLEYEREAARGGPAQVHAPGPGRPGGRRPGQLQQLSAPAGDLPRDRRPSALAVVLTAWVFVDAFVHHTAPRGWASTIVAVLFMGSIQLISLGIIGEYVRLIFLEAKGRPTYIVGE